VLITLKLPRTNQHMTVAVIKRIHDAEGDFLNLGAKRLDLSIDLSSVAPNVATRAEARIGVRPGPSPICVWLPDSPLSATRMMIAVGTGPAIRRYWHRPSLAGAQCAPV
jgi:hypothetical protein